MWGQGTTYAELDSSIKTFPLDRKVSDSKPIWYYNLSILDNYYSPQFFTPDAEIYFKMIQNMIYFVIDFTLFYFIYRRSFSVKSIVSG